MYTIYPTHLITAGELLQCPGHTPLRPLVVRGKIRRSIGCWRDKRNGCAGRCWLSSCFIRQHKTAALSYMHCRPRYIWWVGSLDYMDCFKTAEFDLGTIISGPSPKCTLEPGFHKLRHSRLLTETGGTVQTSGHGHGIWALTQTRCLAEHVCYINTRSLCSDTSTRMRGACLY